MHLSVYLINNNFTDFTEVKQHALHAGYVELPIVNDVADVLALHKRIAHTAPDWVSWISPWVRTDTEDFSSSSPALLLFIIVEQRLFAIPFGFAFTAIDRKVLEHDFGFEVALRILNPNELDLIDIRNVSKKTRQMRSSLSFNGTIQEFDVAIDNELAFKIAGISEVKDFGNKVIGGTSLTFNSSDSIVDLKEKCKLCLETLRNPRKTDFADVNRFVAENDKTKIDELDKWLYDNLVGNQVKDISIAIPEIESTMVSSYVLKKNRQQVTIADLMIDHVASAFQKLQQAIEDIDNIEIKSLDADGKIIANRCYTLRECIVAESKLKGNKNIIHVMSLGKWYRVNKDFVEEINREVNRIETTVNNYLLDANLGEKEKDYNERVSNSDTNKYVCLDRDTFKKGLNRSAIEVCDIYTSDKHLICVKRYHDSQTLSHLFSQGVVSARSLKDFIDYRKFLIQKVGNVGTFDNTTFKENDFTFVYAIIFDRKKTIPNHLPFFSKVRLIADARIIKGLGFNIKLCHIKL